MKILINYSKEFDAVLVELLNLPPQKIINTGNIVIIKGENDELIGVNIFKPAFKKEIKHNLLSDNKKIQKYVREIIREYIKDDFEFETQFVVGQVMSCDPIEGTHLNLCSVNINAEEPLQIVCGAKNVRKDLKVVVATLDSIMPDGTRIVPAQLKGNNSFGMLCSAGELNIMKHNFNKEGIIELNDSYKVGDSFWEVFENEK